MRQFLDIGTGIPTAGNTHQVGQAIAPESRVVGLVRIEERRPEPGGGDAGTSSGWCAVGRKR